MESEFFNTVDAMIGVGFGTMEVKPILLQLLMKIQIEQRGRIIRVAMKNCEKIENFGTDAVYRTLRGFTESFYSELQVAGFLKKLTRDMTPEQVRELLVQEVPAHCHEYALLSASVLLAE